MAEVDFPQLLLESFILSVYTTSMRVVSQGMIRIYADHEKELVPQNAQSWLSPVPGTAGPAQFGPRCPASS